MTAVTEHPAESRFAGTRPDGLPAGLPRPSRVLQLVDADAVSHGLAEGAGLARASDLDVLLGLAQAQAAALTLSGGVDARHITTVVAASTRTAQQHLGVVLASSGNTWRFRRGLDGADQALVEELAALAAALERPCPARRKGRLHAAVLLVGQDHAYAPPVRRLRLLGVPTWVLQPGRFIAADLYRSACEVTSLVPLAAADRRAAPACAASPHPTPTNPTSWRTP